MLLIVFIVQYLISYLLFLFIFTLASLLDLSFSSKFLHDFYAITYTHTHTVCMYLKNAIIFEFDLLFFLNEFFLILSF